MVKKGFREGLASSLRKSKPTRKQLSRARVTEKDLKDPRVRAGAEVGEFARAGLQEPDFTQEQEILHDLFGGGDKIWGTNRNPVNIYNDLNPRQRGDFGTASLFGF